MSQRTSFSALTLLFCLLIATMLQPGRAYAARSQDDQAVAAVLDSLVAATYFDDSHFRQWKDDVPNGFSPTFIPQFDDETYAERIAELNRRTPIRLTYNEHVKNFIKLYAVDKRVMTAKILGLTKTYFPLFEQKLREYNMPTELKYLAIVESALNPVAVSSANAKGLWQFIYGTGKMYGLKSTSFVEDRFDPYKATVAACEHMTDLYDIYGDWFLVLAAYNAGAGNVNKAIRRSGGRRDYWGIWSKLPSETRSYVPAFIAVTYVMNYYKEHNIIPEEPGYLYENIATVNVSDVLAFDQIHEVLGIPLQDLEFLNPQYKRGVIPVIGPAPLSLRLPDHYVDDFNRKEKELYVHKSQSGIDRAQLLASVKEGGKERKIHRVRRGETLASIARMHRCYVSQLIKWNNLRNSRIYPGQKLSVFGAPETIRRSSKPSSAPSIVYHKVRKGESLIRIAKRYKVSVSNLASWNNLGRRRTIYAGQKLKIYGRGSGSTSSSSSVSQTHIVRRGETLGAIAKRYKVSVSNIASWNSLGRRRTIYPGQKLKIYGRGSGSTSSSSSVSQTHIVRRGETLGAIAKRYKVSVSNIASWNSLGRRRTIYPGQKLKINGRTSGSTSGAARTYIVKRGDTLGAIASRYKVSVSKIVSWNNLGKRRLIYPGQKLKVSSH
ncbi:Lytic transglycosylase catalytic [Prosthecochloris aestuarii DSM 271]|uniref:Lytic transglycosylase catalytic n=1 Tax=Prosthecochloris aestuarii (strain DSM 271 / SK 413) TaxID=290512 RepID=B4S8I9_PROA2|nr:LysM peptidoglycan-binding domain-containing protein [Prosthecochloris aestuarii]ACF46376.1 Lytic transglycosylase catalytic [Prosthecochloris aestuarii DSM 271]